MVVLSHKKQTKMGVNTMEEELKFLTKMDDDEEEEAIDTDKDKEETKESDEEEF